MNEKAAAKRYLQHVDALVALMDHEQFVESRWGDSGSREVQQDLLAIKGLVRQHLSEHPADSEKLITEEWLREVGFVWDDVKLRFDSKPNTYTKDTLTITDCCRYAYYGDDDGHWVSIIPVPKTRGDVRRLCAALGITLQGAET